MKLSGKIALVTGGSRGIGFAIAKILSKNGAQVIITANNQDRLEQAISEITNTTYIQANIRNTEEVQRVVKDIIKKYGRLDILVNNAGVFPRIKKLHEIDDDEWEEVLDVNLTGSFRFCRECIPHLIKTSGTIINIASDAGLKAYQGFNVDAYSVSKAALILLTKCCALEYANEKIRVNCICPGVVDTDMSKPFLKTQKGRDFMNNEHPIGRIGQPEEIAKAVLFLVSDDSLWTTGAVLAVDGGESIK